MNNMETLHLLLAAHRCLAKFCEAANSGEDCNLLDLGVDEEFFTVRDRLAEAINKLEAQ